MIVLKTTRELSLMKEACRISAGALRVAGEAVRPGVSTWEIDRIAYEYMSEPDPEARAGFLREEIAYRSGVPGDTQVESLSEEEKKRIADCFSELILSIRDQRFSPCIVTEAGVPREFSAFLHSLHGHAPKGWKFDREEANARR